ncbi:MAG: RNA polymerase sigma factor [Terriglobia bacterium]
MRRRFKNCCKKVLRPTTTSNVKETEFRSDGNSSQDDRYREAAATYGAALNRLAQAYEADPEIRRDLLHEIHLTLWGSFEGFDARCSLRTWVYRVAHNTATSHIIRQRRTNVQSFVGLEEIETMPDKNGGERVADQLKALERLLKLVQRLKPLDRQVIGENSSADVTTLDTSGNGFWDHFSLAWEYSCCQLRSRHSRTRHSG